MLLHTTSNIQTAPAKTVINVILLFMTFVTLTGCTGVSPKAYKSSDTASRLLSKTTNGVRVSVDAVMESSRLKQYFGTDPLHQGIVPVFIRVENVSSPSSILVEKESFSAEVNSNHDSAASLTGDIKYDSKTGTALVGGGLLLLSPAALLLGGAMVTRADAIRSNFVKKELRNQSLASGMSTEGFVYFTSKDKNKPIRRVSLAVPVKNLQTEQSLICDFAIDYEQPK
jgi:hypothetical protein